jgi:hypothetical protein
MTTLAPPRRWLSPEELVTIGYDRSRVVMMNEAHNMLVRSVRTREIGRRILPAAHAAGVRHIAMEALLPEFAEHANAQRDLPEVEGGYLSQPEMRALIGAALDLGWTLIPYEADISSRPPGLDPMSREAANWRDDRQARSLIAALGGLPDDAALLVWCGNDHLAKRGLDEWEPMGVRFAELSGIDPFAINQIRSVEFPGNAPHARLWVGAYADVLARLDGAAGFLAGEAPDGWHLPELADAFILATDNAMS